MSEGKDIWDAYKRVVAPVVPRKPRRVTAKALVEKSAARKSAEAGPLVLPKLIAKPVADSGLERRREKALRVGEIDIEAKLDLHGLTQAQAFAALAAFMAKKSKAGKRHLLIVTGKGREGKGALRTHLPQWLGQLPEAGMILALRPASVKHGGDGAFYVILRRQNKTGH